MTTKSTTVKLKVMGMSLLGNDHVQLTFGSAGEPGQGTMMGMNQLGLPTV